MYVKLNIYKNHTPVPLSTSDIYCLSHIHPAFAVLNNRILTCRHLHCKHSVQTP